MTDPAIRNKLIVALDLATVGDARDVVTRLGDRVTYYKIGLELVMQGGLAFAKELKASGKSVFLDMKLLDIPNTVERAVANAAAIGVDMLTIHGHDSKTLAAAARGKTDSTLKLLAVTVLTSLDADDLAQQGTTMSPADLVLHRAKLAAAAGCDGTVSSGHEAGLIRGATPKNFLIVTPGIRLPGSDTGDQSRVMTPDRAIAAGADYLVVGRPITAAGDPAASAEQFVELIDAAS